MKIITSYFIDTMPKKGIALLLAVLISSLALSASLSIFALLFDQLTFAGTAHESVVAFFAANAAAECVYFSHHIDKLSFTTTEQVRCNGTTVPIVGDDAGERKFNFDVVYSDGRKACAQASTYPGGIPGRNTFIMRGNNVSCDAIAAGASNVIQRVIETRNLEPLSP